MTTTDSGLLAGLQCLTEVQKLIAKYGLAAHLALLAVAPLFLFPFFSSTAVSVVLFWLSALVLVWMAMAPSVLSGERLQTSRKRVVTAILHDPLFWVMVVAVALSAVRAVNGGVSLAYDFESSTWRISTPSFPILPGSVGDKGLFPFAAVLSAMILLQGCRHALGRSARFSFLLLSSALAGVAGVGLLMLVNRGAPEALHFAEFAAGNFSFIGFVFGIYLLLGVVSLFAVLENGWNSVLALSILAIGGNGAACFCFAPAYLAMPFFAAALVLFAYSVFCTSKVLQLSSKVKISIVSMAAVILGVLLVMSVLPGKLLAARLSPYQELVIFQDSFWTIRRAVSEMAFKSWISQLWTGTGLGSFPFDFRFNATEKDWVLLPLGVDMVPNGWWQMLAERGIVGLVFYLLPIGFLAFSYVRRLVDNIRDWSLPHPACLLAPVLLALLGASGFVDCSLIRPEALMICAAVLPISALTFPKKKVEKNG